MKHSVDTNVLYSSAENKQYFVCGTSVVLLYLMVHPLRHLGQTVCIRSVTDSVCDNA